MNNLTRSQRLYLVDLLSTREATVKFKKVRLQCIDGSYSLDCNDELKMIDSIFKLI